MWVVEKNFLLKALRERESFKYRDDITFIGCEPYGYEGDIYQDKFVKFFPQLTYDRLPFDDDSCDIVILEKVAHHLKDFQRMIGEIWRVLKEDGLIFLSEDTYPEDISGVQVRMETDEELTEYFLGLDEFSRKACFIFNDWYGMVLAHRMDNTPLPYRYFSLEEWVKVLEENGFKRDSRKEPYKYLEVPIGGFHQPSTGIISMRKSIKDVGLFSINYSVFLRSDL